MGQQIRLQNKIGRTSLVGQILKLHPTIPRAYILADTPDPEAIGTCGESVPNNYWGLVNLINTVGQNDIVNTTRTVTASATERTTDFTMVFNSATTVYYYLLPATASGRIRNIANIGTGSVVVVPDGDPSDPSAQDLIDDETTQTVDQWENLQIQDWYQNNWKII